MKHKQNPLIRNYTLKKITSAALLGLLLSLPQLKASTLTWGGAAGDNLWGNLNNWDLGRVPGSADTAVIGANASTVTLTAASVVNSVTFSSLAANPLNLALNGNLRVVTGITVEANDLFDTQIANAMTMTLGNSATSLTGVSTVSFTNNSNKQLTISGAGKIQMGATGSAGATLTLAVGGAGSTVIGQTITRATSSNPSTLNLSKTGSGTLTLSGVNGINGTTTIGAGTLLLGNASALGGGGNVNVQGGTLNSSVANVNLGGNLSLSDGTLDLNNAGVGSFTLGADKSFTMTGGKLNFDLGDSFDQVMGSGGNAAFSITSGTFALNVSGAGFSYGKTYQLLQGFEGSNSVAGLSFTGYDTTNYEASFNTSGILSFTAVPEPASWAMLVGGLGMLVALRRVGGRR